METIDVQSNKEFYINLQKAILLSLLNEKLLTQAQFDRACELLFNSHLGQKNHSELS